MSSAVTIDNITNNLDGVTATVTISGTPSGALTFWASRVPVTSAALQVPAAGSGDTWNITFTHPGMWYLYCQDNNGFSAIEASVVVQSSNNSPTSECGTFLASTLWANRRGIQAFLQQEYPNQTLKQSIFGQAADINDWPSILVSEPRNNTSYMFFPWGTETIFSYTISCICVHEDEKEEVKLASRFADGVLAVINQPYYNVFDLPSGVGISLALGTATDISDMPVGERMAAVAHIAWSGSAILQDPGF